MINERSSNDFEQFRALRGLKTPRFLGGMRQGDRPRPNILRGIAVGVVAVVALLAAEAQAITVGRRYMAAGIAATACVSGIDQLQVNSNGSSLVSDLESGIGVWPAMDFGSEVFPLVERRISNVAQVFKYDTTCTNLNRVTDQCLGCDMQEMSRYGSLMPAHAPEEATGGTSANGLNGCAGATNAGATVIQHPALEEKCLGVIRVGGDEEALDSCVHANDAPIRLRLWDINFVDEADEPNLTDALYLGVLPSGLRDVRMLQCNRSAQYGYSGLGSAEVPPVSYGHHWGTVCAETPLSECLQCLVAGRNLTKERTSKLGRDAKLLTYNAVERFVQPIRVQLFGFEHLPGHPAGGSQIASGHLIKMFRFTDLALYCSNSFQQAER